jgi:hypothetical protein
VNLLNIMARDALIRVLEWVTFGVAGRRVDVCMLSNSDGITVVRKR